MIQFSRTECCLIDHLPVSLFSSPLSLIFFRSPLPHILSSPLLLPLSTDSKTPHRLQELSPSPQFIVNGATRLDVRQGKLSKYTAPVYTTYKTVCFDTAPKEDYIKVSVRQQRLSTMKDLKLSQVSKSTHDSEEAKSSGIDLLLTRPADLKWQLLLSTANAGSNIRQTWAPLLIKVTQFRLLGSWELKVIHTFCRRQHEDFSSWLIGNSSVV